MLRCRIGLLDLPGKILEATLATGRLGFLKDVGGGGDLMLFDEGLCLVRGLLRSFLTLQNVHPKDLSIAQKGTDHVPFQLVGAPESSPCLNGFLNEALRVRQRAVLIELLFGREFVPVCLD
jgi:hypothetical protein